jgi:hypothetical protein
MCVGAVPVYMHVAERCWKSPQTVTLSAYLVDDSSSGRQELDNFTVCAQVGCGLWRSASIRYGLT